MNCTWNRYRIELSCNDIVVDSQGSFTMFTEECLCGAHCWWVQSPHPTLISQIYLSYHLMVWWMCNSQNVMWGQAPYSLYIDFLDCCKSQMSPAIWTLIIRHTYMSAWERLERERWQHPHVSRNTLLYYTLSCFFFFLVNINLWDPFPESNPSTKLSGLGSQNVGPMWRILT